MWYLSLTEAHVVRHRRPPPRTKVRDYAELVQGWSLRQRLRSAARKTAIFLLSLPARISGRREWIFFPYYHHVLDDERRGFDRQLTYMRQFGEFVSLDDAITALQNPGGLGGRYFCVSFDDGFRSCLTNALPILLDHRCPAAFFVPTNHISLDLDENRDAFRGPDAFGDTPFPPLEHLTWDECHQLQVAEMTIGSHTCSHARPAGLDPAGFDAELRESKARIECQLGKPCHHFACPWGQPFADFDPTTHPAQARKVGYRSFLTTVRGPNSSGADAYFIRRDHMLAGDSMFVLRYFLSRKG